MSSVSLDDFAGDPPARDFRRANGAPMVRRIDDPTKWDRYSRPSGWGGDLDDESALVLWKIDRAMEGVASDPSIAATVASKIGIKEGAKERRERAIQRGRGDEAADTGTALHAMTERVERNDGFIAPPPYDADIAAYLLCLERAGLVSDFIEVKLVADQWRAAGTADRIYRVTKRLQTPDGFIEPGEFIMGDLKTGQKMTYSVPGYCIQLAIYADSCLYDVETNERTLLPDNLRSDWGLLVHMASGSGECTLLWADLRIGREGAKTVQMVRKWRKRKDFVEPFLMPVDETAAELEAIASVALDGDTHSFGDGCDPPHSDQVDEYLNSLTDEWIDMMLPYAQERINRIGVASNECRDLLMRRWPANVPPLRAARPYAGQLATILDLLDAVEAAFSLPFLPDPRVTQSAGLHKSEIDRTNQPPNQGTTEP